MWCSGSAGTVQQVSLLANYDTAVAPLCVLEREYIIRMYLEEFFENYLGLVVGVMREERWRAIMFG